LGIPTFIFTSLILALLFLLSSGSVTAQDEGSDGPYYVVQEGDTLWDIAWRFGVLLEDLQAINGVSDPNQISGGSRLLIPGLEDIQGRVETMTVPYGETARSLSRRFGKSVDLLARINRLSNPGQIYAGRILVVPEGPGAKSSFKRTQLAPGQSLLEHAVIMGVNPWTVIGENNLPGSWIALPADILFLSGQGRDGPGALPETINQLVLDPMIPVQGKTIVIRAAGPDDLVLHGSVAGYPLHFFPYDDGYVAMQGIHPMLEPGLYPLTVEGEFASGESFAFSQPVLIRSGDYPFDPPLSVNPATLDTSVTIPEDELWASLALPVTEEKMWRGLFSSPVPEQLKRCWTSLFGSRRSYNGSPYNFYHAGLDFCGTTGTPLYATADGRVVYTGFLVVRGGVTVIDHGWGVYTAYAHQSEILVKPGDLVEGGQVIGLGGGTGRSTGPHLHWEVWVGGVPVDPINWLEQVFP
jgi:murein DD-endopeptidase MepM/ murein hydrolase activator NlpD